QLTIVGEILGTPSYMAPEQAAGESQELDRRADIYSAGACLYRILTQRCPFESDSLPKLFYQIIAEDPRPPSHYQPKIHPDLDAIVLKSLEKSKEKRYASAKDFAQDLEHFQKGYPLIARPSTFWERFFKWVRRYLKILIPLGMMFFFVLASLFYFQWKQDYIKQKHRITLSQEAQTLYTQAINLPEQKPHLKQKFELLLESLYKLNSALILFPQDRPLEQKKEETLKQLLRLALEAQEYELATYLASEVSKLSMIDVHEKTLLKQTVNAEKTKVLQNHLNRLNEWFVKLKEGGVSKQERENALFEISRMSEPEIQKQLQAVLETGTTYFLEDQDRSIRDDHFYQTIALILGYSGQVSSGDPLLQNLKKLAQKVRQFNRKNQEWTDLDFIHYMIILTQSLSTLQIPYLSQEIQEIRLLFGEGSVYWKETGVAYQRLQEAETAKNSNESLSSEESIFQGIRYFQKKEWESALFIFSRILQQNPLLPEAYHYRGLTYYFTGKYALSLQDFRQEIQYHPNAIAYFYCGLIENLQEDWSQSIQDLTQAIRFDPKNVDAFYQRGYAFEQQGNSEEALQNYQETLQLDAHYAKAYHQRGQILMQRKEWKSALQDFSEAIRFSPHEEQFYLSRARLKYQLQDWEGSLQDLSEILERDSPSAIAYFYRAQIRQEKKDQDGALEDYQKAIQLDPKSADFYYSRGSLRYDLQNYREALADLNECLRLETKKADPYCLRGRIWEKSNNFTNAINDYSQALLLNPKHQQSRIYRGNLREKIQDLEGALQDYSSVIQLEPD
ncbi:MAG: tetratricopeptide repeat protein, partial [Planctomycetota bacterium]